MIDQNDSTWPIDTVIICLFVFLTVLGRAMTVKFVAYIDEAGDDGLKRIYPTHPNGSSEWFVLSCVLVRIENDRKMLELVKEVIGQFSNSQRKDIHYKDLIPVKKAIICDAISQANVRSFVVMSNKKNMLNYSNERVANSKQIFTSSKNWFYWWAARCLLERVTEECEYHASLDNDKNSKLKIIFSRRGGMNYSHFRAYMQKLQWQSESKSLFLNLGDIRWSVIDHNEIYAFDHKSMAGLQLADVIASAFFQSVTESKTRPCDPRFAKMLHKTVAYKVKSTQRGDQYRQRFGYGVKILPSLEKAELSLEQTEIFDHYRSWDWIRKR